MSPSGFSLQLHHVDAGSHARRSTFHTPRGPVEMPAFMPVGTQATVKGMEIEQVRATGAEMILANTYHLALRPSEQVVAALGGLHRFMGWDGPILTDSGGFQVFSLAAMVKVSEEGATFRSHLDGDRVELTPERALLIQETLGSDIAMVLDHVVALPNDLATLRDACDRTIRWAARALRAQRRTDMAQFAIVQGGLDSDLRNECARQLVAMDFPGYAVGGLSVGEPPPEMYRILTDVVPSLPADRPRYLMGVGRPEDLLEAVRRGIDLFDCVLPTRNGRNAMAYTDAGPVRLRNRRYATDDRPLDPTCPCPACRRSLGYLRHLFMVNEMLGPILLTMHNLTYYQRLLAESREAIAADRFTEFAAEKHRGWTAAEARGDSV
jgi:queuine tRNA-ribosyltransferase